MKNTIPNSVFNFLSQLKENNDRNWILENKARYLQNEKSLKEFYISVMNDLNITDEIASMKIYRINRDIRFSVNKTPYNVHRSVSFSRAGAQRRGGYYLRLEPGNSYMAGGFFDPNPKDLLRIRREFEMDSSEIREILAQREFKKAFGNFVQEDLVKTAPKGFNQQHENIDLIRLKNYFVRHAFTDETVLSEGFQDSLVHHYQLMRPLFDYMSDVLTTDLNGISLLE